MITKLLYRGSFVFFATIAFTLIAPSPAIPGALEGTCDLEALSDIAKLRRERAAAKAAGKQDASSAAATYVPNKTGPAIEKYLKKAAADPINAPADGLNASARRELNSFWGAVASDRKPASAVADGAESSKAQAAKKLPATPDPAEAKRAALKAEAAEREAKQAAAAAKAAERAEEKAVAVPAGPHKGVAVDGHLRVFHAAFNPPHEGQVEALRNFVRETGAKEVLVIANSESEARMAEMAFSTIPEARFPHADLQKALSGRNSGEMLDILAGKNKQVTSLMRADELDPAALGARKPNVSFALAARKGDPAAGLAHDLAEAKGFRGRLNELEVKSETTAKSVRRALDRGETPAGVSERALKEMNEARLAKGAPEESSRSIVSRIFRRGEDTQRPTVAQLAARTEAHVADRAKHWVKDKNCMSCHTVLPLAFSMPPAGQRTAATKDAIKEIRKYIEGRADNFTTHRPWYAGPKAAESRGSETVLSAMLVATDEHGGAASALQKKVFTNLRKEQGADGSFSWLNYNLEPFESKGGKLFGNALATVAYSKAGDDVMSVAKNKEAFGKLKDFLRTEAAREDLNLIDKSHLLWADSVAPDLLTPAQAKAFAKDILASQDSGGGFSMNKFGPWEKRGLEGADKGDPLATSLTLNALKDSKGVTAAQREDLDKGFRWLKDQRQDDGTFKAYSVNRDRDLNHDFMTDFSSNLSSALVDRGTYALRDTESSASKVARETRPAPATTRGTLSAAGDTQAFQKMEDVVLANEKQIVATLQKRLDKTARIAELNEQVKALDRQMASLNVRKDYAGEGYLWGGPNTGGALGSQFVYRGSDRDVSLFRSLESKREMAEDEAARVRRQVQRGGWDPDEAAYRMAREDLEGKRATLKEEGLDGLARKHQTAYIREDGLDNDVPFKVTADMKAAHAEYKAAGGASASMVAREVEQAASRAESARAAASSSAGKAEAILRDLNSARPELETALRKHLNAQESVLKSDKPFWFNRPFNFTQNASYWNTRTQRLRSAEEDLRKAEKKFADLRKSYEGTRASLEPEHRLAIAKQELAVSYSGLQHAEEVLRDAQLKRDWAYDSLRDGEQPWLKMRSVAFTRDQSNWGSHRKALDVAEANLAAAQKRVNELSADVKKFSDNADFDRLAIAKKEMAALRHTSPEQQLKPAENSALVAAHKVGLGEKGRDGSLASVGNFTDAQLKRKAEILKDAGFSEAERRALMEKEVVGVTHAESVAAAREAQARVIAARPSDSVDNLANALEKVEKADYRRSIAAGSETRGQMLRSRALKEADTEFEKAQAEFRRVAQAEANAVANRGAQGAAWKEARSSWMGSRSEMAHAADEVIRAQAEMNHLPKPGKVAKALNVGRVAREYDNAAFQYEQALDRFGAAARKYHKDRKELAHDASQALFAPAPRQLSPAQLAAVEKAHYVGAGEKGRSGRVASIGNFTDAQLRKKAEILKTAGFSEAERRTLMEAGVVGLEADESAVAAAVRPFQNSVNALTEMRTAVGDADWSLGYRIDNTRESIVKMQEAALRLTESERAMREALESGDVARITAAAPDYVSDLNATQALRTATLDSLGQLHGQLPAGSPHIAALDAAKHEVQAMQVVDAHSARVAEALRSTLPPEHFTPVPENRFTAMAIKPEHFADVKAAARAYGVEELPNEWRGAVNKVHQAIQAMPGKSDVEKGDLMAKFAESLDAKVINKLPKEERKNVNYMLATSVNRLEEFKPYEWKVVEQLPFERNSSFGTFDRYLDYTQKYLKNELTTDGGGLLSWPTIRQMEAHNGFPVMLLPHDMYHVHFMTGRPQGPSMVFNSARSKQADRWLLTSSAYEAVDTFQTSAESAIARYFDQVKHMDLDEGLLYLGRATEAEMKKIMDDPAFSIGAELQSKRAEFAGWTPVTTAATDVRAYNKEVDEAVKTFAGYRDRPELAEALKWDSNRVQRGSESGPWVTADDGRKNYSGRPAEMPADTSASMVSREARSRSVVGEERLPEHVQPVPQNRYTENLAVRAEHLADVKAAAQALGVENFRGSDWKSVVNDVHAKIFNTEGKTPLEKGEQMAQFAASLDEKVISKLPKQERVSVNYMLGLSVTRLEAFTPNEFKPLELDAFKSVAYTPGSDNLVSFDRYLPYTKRYLDGDTSFVQGGLLSREQIRELEAHNMFPAYIDHDMTHVHWATGHPMGVAPIFESARSRNHLRWTIQGSLYESVDTVQFSDESAIARYFDQTRRMDIDEGMTFLMRASKQELDKIGDETGYRNTWESIANSMAGYSPRTYPGENVNTFAADVDKMVVDFAKYRDNPELESTLRYSNTPQRGAGVDHVAVDDARKHYSGRPDADGGSSASVVARESLTPASDRAIASPHRAVLAFDRGVAVDGKVTKAILNEKGEAVFVKMDGATSLKQRGPDGKFHVIKGQDEARHAGGYSTPIGNFKVAGTKFGADNLDAAALKALKGKEVTLNYDSGIKLVGKLDSGVTNAEGKPILLTLKDTDVFAKDGSKLYQKEWGDFDLLVSKEMSHVGVRGTNTKADPALVAVHNGTLVQDVAKAERRGASLAADAGEESRAALAARAQEALSGRKLSDNQAEAVERAHLVGAGQPGRDGELAGIGNYTDSQLRQKAEILKAAGFSEADRRALMESGVVGRVRAASLTPAVAVPKDRFAEALPKLTRTQKTAIAKAAKDFGVRSLESDTWHGAVTEVYKSINAMPRKTPVQKGELMAEFAAKLDRGVINKMTKENRTNANYLLGKAVTRLEAFKPSDFKASSGDRGWNPRGRNLATFDNALDYTKRYLNGDTSFVSGSIINASMIRDMEANNIFPAMITHDMTHVHFSIGHPRGALMIHESARSQHPNRWIVQGAAYEAVDTVQTGEESAIAKYFDKQRNMTIEEGMVWISRATDRELNKIMRDIGAKREDFFYTELDWTPTKIAGRDPAGYQDDLNKAVAKYAAYRDKPELEETLKYSNRPQTGRGVTEHVAENNERKNYSSWSVVARETSPEGVAERARIASAVADRELGMRHAYQELERPTKLGGDGFFAEEKRVWNKFWRDIGREDLIGETAPYRTSSPAKLDPAHTAYQGAVDTISAERSKAINNAIAERDLSLNSLEKEWQKNPLRLRAMEAARFRDEANPELLKVWDEHSAKQNEVWQKFFKANEESGKVHDAAMAKAVRDFDEARLAANPVAAKADAEIAKRFSAIDQALAKRAEARWDWDQSARKGFVRQFLDGLRDPEAAEQYANFQKAVKAAEDAVPVAFNNVPAEYFAAARRYGTATGKAVEARAEALKKAKASFDEAMKWSKGDPAKVRNADLSLKLNLADAARVYDKAIADAKERRHLDVSLALAGKPANTVADAGVSRSVVGAESAAAKADGTITLEQLRAVEQGGHEIIVIRKEDGAVMSMGPVSNIRNVGGRWEYQIRGQGERLHDSYYETFVVRRDAEGIRELPLGKQLHEALASGADVVTYKKDGGVLARGPIKDLYRVGDDFHYTQGTSKIDTRAGFKPVTTAERATEAPAARTAEATRAPASAAAMSAEEAAKPANREIVIISGTTREGSMTLKVTEAMKAKYEAAGAKVRVLDLRDMPIEDFGPNRYWNTSQRFKDEFESPILKSRGIVIVAPEYNGSYPGVLKHFTDLLKYPDSFKDRPISLVGLSAGMTGAARGADQLANNLQYPGGLIQGKRVYMPRVESLFTDGKLTDAKTIGFIEDSVKDFLQFSERNPAPMPAAEASASKVAREGETARDALRRDVADSLGLNPEQAKLLTDRQLRAIEDARAVGTPDSRGVYTIEQYAQKGDILRHAGFDSGERMKLMQSDVMHASAAQAEAAVKATPDLDTLPKAPVNGRAQDFLKTARLLGADTADYQRAEAEYQTAFRAFKAKPAPGHAERWLNTAKARDYRAAQEALQRAETKMELAAGDAWLQGLRKYEAPIQRDLTTGKHVRDREAAVLSARDALKPDMMEQKATIGTGFSALADPAKSYARYAPKHEAAWNKFAADARAARFLEGKEAKEELDFARKQHKRAIENAAGVRNQNVEVYRGRLARNTPDDARELSERTAKEWKKFDEAVAAADNEFRQRVERAMVKSALNEQVAQLARKADIEQALASVKPGRKVNAAEFDAVEKAHLVGHGQMGNDGRAAKVGNYTPAQLKQKAEILKSAGFSEAERRALMEKGIVGEGAEAVANAAPAANRATDAAARLAEAERALANTPRPGLVARWTGISEEAHRYADAQRAVEEARAALAREARVDVNSAVPNDRFAAALPALTGEHKAAVQEAAQAIGVPGINSGTWHGAVSDVYRAIDSMPGKTPVDKGELMAQFAEKLDAPVLNAMDAEQRKSVNYLLGKAVNRLEAFSPADYKPVENTAGLGFTPGEANLVTFDNALDYTKRYLRGDTSYVEGSIVSAEIIREIEAHNMFPAMITHDMTHVHYSLSHPRGALMIHEAARSQHPNRWIIQGAAYEAVDTTQTGEESAIAKYFDKQRNMTIEEGMLHIARASNAELNRIMSDLGTTRTRYFYTAEDWKPHAYPGSTPADYQRKLDEGVRAYAALRDNPENTELLKYSNRPQRGDGVTVHVQENDERKNYYSRSAVTREVPSPIAGEAPLLTAAGRASIRHESPAAAAAYEFAEQARDAIRDARRRHLNGNRNQAELNGLTDQYGYMERPVTGSTEESRRLGYLQQEMAAIKRDRAVAVADGDKARLQKLDQEYRLAATDLAAASAVVSATKRDRSAKQAAVMSLASDDTFARYQDRFPGRSFAEVSKDPVESKLLRELRAQDQASSAALVKEAREEVVKSMRTLTKEAGPAPKAEKLADDLIAAKSTLKPNAKPEELRAALGKKGWNEAQVNQCLGTKMCAVGEFEVAKAAPKPEAARAVMEQQLVNASAKDLTRVREIAREPAKAVPAAKPFDKVMGDLRDLRKMIVGSDSADAKRAATVVENRIKTLEEYKDVLAKARPLTEAEEKVNDKAVTSVLDFLKNPASRQQLEAIPGLRGKTIALPANATGEQRLGAYRLFKETVGDMKSGADRAAVLDLVRKHAMKGTDELAAALKKAPNADPKVVANMLEDVDRVRKAAADDNNALARALYREAKLKPEEQALADAVGLSRSEAPASAVERRAVAAAETKKVETSVKAVAAKEAERAPASVAPADPAQRLKQVTKLEGKELSDLAAAISFVEKNDKAGLADTLRHVEGLAKSDPETFDTYRAAYVNAAELMRKDKNLKAEQAWEQGMKQMLEDLFGDKAKAEELYRKTAACLKMRG